MVKSHPKVLNCFQKCTHYTLLYTHNLCMVFIVFIVNDGSGVLLFTFLGGQNKYVLYTCENVNNDGLPLSKKKGCKKCLTYLQPSMRGFVLGNTSHNVW